jgi:flagellar basal-body rod protein FlgG
MPDGEAIAAASMRTHAARLDSLGSNLTNLLTPGYKRQVAAFPQIFSGDLPLAGDTLVPAVSWDMRPGPLRNTGNALDLAIEGDAFFELKVDGRLAYTRQGSFVLDAQGRLQTADGALVQGVSGDIVLETHQPSIDAQGRVFDGDNQIGQLRLVRFDHPARLQAVSNSRYLQGQAEIAADRSSPRAILRQGFLEGSNVVTSDEMVKLMESVRQFESGQRVILWFGDMHDQVRQRLGEF